MVKAIPEGYHSITPYLIVEDAAGLIGFVSEAFGATERMRMPPSGPTIMHAEVQIGDSIVMLSDASPEFPPKPAMLHLYIQDVDATYQSALAAGGTSVREPDDQFYGDRSAGVRDRFGNEWWLATHVKDLTPEEVARLQETAGEPASAQG